MDSGHQTSAVVNKMAASQEVATFLVLELSGDKLPLEKSDDELENLAYMQISTLALLVQSDEKFHTFIRTNQFHQITKIYSSWRAEGLGVEKLSGSSK